MSKQNYKLRRLVDSSIKEGDEVMFYDGSSFSLKNIPMKEGMYIPYEYPEVFGSDKPIKELVFTVKQTGIIDTIVGQDMEGITYHVDCIVSHNGIDVYTCSAMVRAAPVLESVEQAFRSIPNRTIGNKLLYSPSFI